MPPSQDPLRTPYGIGHFPSWSPPSHFPAFINCTLLYQFLQQRIKKKSLIKQSVIMVTRLATWSHRAGDSWVHNVSWWWRSTEPWRCQNPLANRKSPAPPFLLHQSPLSIPSPFIVNKRKECWKHPHSPLQHRQLHHHHPPSSPSPLSLRVTYPPIICTIPFTKPVASQSVPSFLHSWSEAVFVYPHLNKSLVWSLLYGMRLCVIPWAQSTKVLFHTIKP